MKKLALLALFLSPLALALALPFNYIQWGTAAAPAYVVLLDGGPQQSIARIVDNTSTVSVVCTAVDAGTNAAAGTATLLGSNDSANWVQISTVQTFPGNQTTVAWDPVVTGMQYLSVAVDGGGTLAGVVSCTLFGKGINGVN